MIARRLFALVGGLLVAAVSTAQIQYAQRSVPIRAGVVLIDSYRVNFERGNGAPYVFYNLEQSNSVKPGGWNFINPHAESVLSAGSLQRYTNMGLLPQAPATTPGVGSTLTKGAAPYWEVLLSDSSDLLLADYDILALSVRGPLSLTPFEREKLRAFVDQGGVLWVDVDQSTVLDPANSIPLAIDRASAGGVTNADLSHPLLNRPLQISLSQIGLMQTDNSPGFTAMVPGNYGASAVASILAPLESEFDRYELVAGNTGEMLIGVGHLGNGTILVTARGAANALNRGRTDPANSRLLADRPSRDSASDAAASLVVNALHLAASYRESFSGTRKRNSNAIELRPPLLRMFHADLAQSPGNRNFVPPATYKGLLVVSGTDRLYVFDGNPNTDLDGDGNTDDGLPDTDFSAGLDLLWTSVTMPGPISSPTCLTVENFTTPATRDQILVVDANGDVRSFNPFAFVNPPTGTDLTLIAQSYQASPPGGAATFDMTVDGRGPYGPTIHNNLAYIGDVQTGLSGRVGRVWVMDPSKGSQLTTGVNPWILGGSSSTAIPEISGPPTIGYIPIQDSSGGEDLVMYVPTRPNPAALGSPEATAGITSLWMGVRGEKPQRVEVVGGNLVVTARANFAGLHIFQSAGSDPMGIKVSVFNSTTGTQLDAAQLASVFTGVVGQGPDGELQLELGSAGWNPNYTLRLDYMIDWGSGSLTLTEQTRRGNLFFPDVARTRRVIGAVALGADGRFFVTVSDQSRGGALYGFKEEGRGIFKLLYRYELFDQHNMNLSLTSTVPYRETFINEDGISSLVPFFAGPLTQLTMQGSPAIKNGTVFVTGSAQVGVFALPVTILMAFKEQPEAPRIPIVGEINETFMLIQPDIARSVNPTDPEASVIAQGSQFLFEQKNGNGLITINDLMASKTGSIQQALSSSQPMILRRNGVPDMLLEPDQVGGHWSPLLWYAVLAGTSNQSPPIVAGDTVYVGGNSKLPDILAGVAPASAVDRGVMFAMDATVQPAPPTGYPNSIRPWQIQVPMVRVNGSNIETNPAVRWPQTSGLTDFEDWKVRYYQTALRTGDTAFGIASGEGALYAWGPTAIYGFTRGDMLIADDGRLLRLDSAGNPIWSSDTSIGTGSGNQSGATSTVKGLVRPVRAYRLGTDQVVAADPGSNRIVRLNLAGKEIRSVTGFKLDPNYTPDGYVSGESLKLNGPTDVATYAATVQAAQNQLSNVTGPEYWIYYLVADSANRRLVEIIDRYMVDPSTGEVGDPVVDANGERQLGVLTWHSPSNYTGKDFRYNGVARVFNPSTGKFVYAGGLGSATPARTDLGLETPTSASQREANLGSGGIILFDGSQTQVINSIVIPALPANVYWNESTTSFSSNARQQRSKPVGDLRSVTMRFINESGQPRLAVMFTDASGVYEVYQPTVGPTEAWVVRWMLPKEMYKVMRRASNAPTNDNPRDLNATFARRLDSGEVVVVNGYLGQTRGRTPFSGEVIVLDGEFDLAADNALPGFSFQKENLGFKSLSVRLQLSKLSGVRSISAPVFADLR